MPRKQPLRVLMIDDDQEIIEMVRLYLAESGRHDFRVDGATGFDDGLERLLSGDYDVCLLDYRLGPRTGLELLRCAREVTSSTPVIMLTGHGNELVAAEAFKSGAADYLPKRLLNRVRLSSAIFSALHKVRKRERVEESSRKLMLLSIMDGLTKLFRRHYILDRADKEIAVSRRAGTPLCLAMADIDHFKKINDTHGHLAGDAVLANLAALMPKKMREIDLIGRYGGEEFCFLMPRTTLEQAARAIERLRNVIEHTPLPISAQRKLSVTCSFGIAELSRSDRNLRSLVDRADRALYRAKQQGRNRVVCAPRE